ncbi:MAG: methyltransferase domain-containing protein [DPANN group archaeon]|nr:methyltransferase domain-containing protein [DPANN group archaeon]
MSDVTEITKQTYNKIANKWAQKYSGIELVNTKLNKFMNYVRPGRKILDVGCGSGKYMKWLLACGFDAIGIDFSKNILDEARQRVPSGDFRLMDMRKLKFKDNSFDGVVSTASLLHIPKKQASGVLEDFKRVMKNKSIILISVKYGRGESLCGIAHKRFFSYYTKAELVNLLKKHGFKLLESFFEFGDGIKWLVVLARVTK